jgi:hypothetical protein
MAIKFTKVSSKPPRAKAIKGGEVSAPQLSQLRGRGQNAGGSPNDLRKLFPKSSRSTPKVKVPSFSDGGMVNTTNNYKKSCC